MSKKKLYIKNSFASSPDMEEQIIDLEEYKKSIFKSDIDWLTCNFIAGCEDVDKKTKEQEVLDKFMRYINEEKTDEFFYDNVGCEYKILQE